MDAYNNIERTETKYQKRSDVSINNAGINNLSIENEIYLYWLCNIEGIGNKTITKLLLQYGDGEQIYKLSQNEIAKALTKKQAEAFTNSRKSWDLQKQYALLQKENIKFISILHPAYPKKLKQIADAPVSLYLKGELPNENKINVAIIGARECSYYGAKMAEELAKSLAQFDVSVISGMARGIDGIAQKAAVNAGGYTYGVLGCGVDICYPKEHERLYDTVIKRGGLLSEYPQGTMPKANLFPARNRIISGLSDVLVVIEAKERSGTCITVDMALEQGREVYALPGRVNDKLSYGCNRLIRQGAGIIISIEEFLEEIGIQAEKKQKQIDTSYPFVIKKCSENEKQIYNLLDCTPKSLQQIYTESRMVEMKISLPECMQCLLDMELKKVIKQPYTGYYVK